MANGLPARHDSPRGLERATGGRHQAFEATTLALRERLAALALEGARVAEARAALLDRLAAGDVSQAYELHARAAAARRYAETERETARRFSSG